MHAITSDGGRYQLRIELEVANGTKYYETYDDFSVGPPKDFVLHVGSFNGNAGNMKISLPTKPASLYPVYFALYV